MPTRGSARNTIARAEEHAERQRAGADEEPAADDPPRVEDAADLDALATRDRRRA